MESWDAVKRPQCPRFRSCEGFDFNRGLRSLSNRGVAQLVEQRSPKPQVEGSSPSAPAISRGGGTGRHAILRGWWAKAYRSSSLLLGTIRGSSSVVERLLAKEKVVGSSPIFRSKKIFSPVRRGYCGDVAKRLRRGSAKPLFGSSNLPVASSQAL